jgi:hypothetical protein
MAEKRVSVRLSAVGGRQVRAELEGVGEAGSRGFGRLSREMELANARLAAFSRRVRIAAVAAVAATAAAGVAMVRSGLQTVDAQAKLAASLATTVASIQVLERAGDLAGVSMGQVEQAALQLTRRLSQAAAGTGPVVDALTRLQLTAAELQALPLDQRIALIQDRLAEFVPEAERAALASQLFGDRAGLVFTRIDTATLRQATDDVRDFGVVVSDQDAAQIERTNDAISRLGLVWRGLSNQLAVAAAPALEAVADAMAVVANRTGPLGSAIRGLFDNIGRLITYAGTFATFLAGRWVASFAVAALSVRGLAMALVVMRAALIRTGVGALIVGAGELVHQFNLLVSGAGGFGNAMALLGSVATEVWDRIKLGAASFAASAMAAFASVEAVSVTAMQGALEGVVSFANGAVNSFEGAFAAIKAVWGMLPAAIGDLAFQAANSLVSGVEAMLNGVTSRINGFLGGLNTGLEALGVDRRIGLIADLDLGELENRFAGAARQTASAAQDAFASAFADNPLTVPDLGLTEAARDAAASAEDWRQSAATLANGALKPLASLEALRAAMRDTGPEAEGIFDGAALAADRLNAALAQEGTGGRPAAALEETAAAAGRAGAAMQSAADLAGQAWNTATDALERTKEIARGLAADITGPIKEALKSGELSWQSFAGAVSGIAQNLANRLIDTAFKPIEDALFRALAGAGAGSGGGGGLFGGLTSALGGLFGMGSTFAHGGAFGQAGEITAFASGGVVSGGVVSRPTVFPFARGIGLMGEAGPEAILPLRRGRGGRLGVEMNGESAGSTAPAMSTRIINVLDPSVVGDYLATPSGERAILNVIRRNRGAINA